MPKRFQIFQEFPSRNLPCLDSLINLRYFGHTFGTRKARKSIKPSKDLHYNLESNKILIHEIGSFGRLPGVDDVIQM